MRYKVSNERGNVIGSRALSLYFMEIGEKKKRRTLKAETREKPLINKADIGAIHNVI